MTTSIILNSRSEFGPGSGMAPELRDRGGNNTLCTEVTEFLSLNRILHQIP